MIMPTVYRVASALSRRLLSLLLLSTFYEIAFARRVALAWKRDYPFKDIKASNLASEICGLPCEENCVNLDNQDVTFSHNGCFNVGMLTAREDIEKLSSGVKPPVTTVIASTMGAPSVVVGYCEPERHISECLVSAADDVDGFDTETGFWTKAIANHHERASTLRDATRLRLDMLTFGPSRASVGRNVFSVGVHVESLVEFEDRNDNGMFDGPHLDRVLREIPLDSFNFLPAEMSSNVPVAGEEYFAARFDATSANGEIRLVCEMTPVVDDSGRGTSSSLLRSQNSALCEVTMSGQIVDCRGRMALHLVVVNPTGNAEVPVRRESPSGVAFTERSELATRGYVLVDETVVVGVVDSTTQSTASAILSDLVAEESAESVAYSLAKSQVELSDTAQIFSTYASIGMSERNRTRVSWHFSVGYGTPPVEENVDDTLEDALLVLFGVGIAGVVLCVLVDRVVNRREERGDEDAGHVTREGSREGRSLYRPLISSTETGNDEDGQGQGGGNANDGPIRYRFYRPPPATA